MRKARTFGEHLRQARELRGWSRRELDKLSGVSQPSIENYEMKGDLPKLATLHKLGEALGSKWESEAIALLLVESTRCYDHTELDLREREPVLVLA